MNTKKYSDLSIFGRPIINSEHRLFTASLTSGHVLPTVPFSSATEILK